MEQEVANFTFRGQREDEEVLILIHQHPWAMAKPGLIATAALAIIIVMFIWFQASGPAIWTLFILGAITLLYIGYHWFVWWNTMYLLTNQRAITITQRGIWSRRIEDYNLDKIQSVASDTAGAAGTLLNFGDVFLAIMGIKEPVSLHYVEDPRAVQEQLLDAMRTASSAHVKINDYNAPKKRKLIQN
jgi:hypothetical protein